MRKSANTCMKATQMLHDDPDKSFFMWEEGWDDLLRSAGVYNNCGHGIAKATASIKGTPLYVVLKENGLFSKFGEDFDRTSREFCVIMEDFLGASRNRMKKLPSDREKLKTLQMIAKELATLTLGISVSSSVVHEVISSWHLQLEYRLMSGD